MIQNTINFSNVKADYVFSKSGKYTHSDNVNGNRFDTSITAEELSPSINAIEIDWNGAEVDENVVINTTGELLAWIKAELEIAGQSGASLTEEQIQTLEDATNILTFMKQYVTSQLSLNAIESEISEINDALATKYGETDVANYLSTNQYQTAADVNAAIQRIVGMAPEALDTLQEIAEVLAGNDDVEHPVAGLIEVVGQKANSADVYTKQEIDEALEEIELTSGKSAYEVYKDTVNEHEAVPAIYSFTSFATGTEIQYGTGKVKIVSQDSESTIVEVIENNPIDVNAADFVGQQFKLNTIELTSSLLDLFTLDDQPTGISVTAELFSEAQPAVVAMTEEQWLASLKGAQGDKGETGAQGAQGPQGDPGSFDSSALEDYVTITALNTKIGNLGNKVEAADAVYEAVENGTTLTSGDTYYTSNTGAGEFVSNGTEIANGSNYYTLVSEAVTAVPYTSVAEVITDNEEVVATALTDLASKYEALLARVVALEGAQGAQS